MDYFMMNRLITKLFWKRRVYSRTTEAEPSDSEFYKISSKRSYKKAFAFSITMWIIASLLFATVVILRFAKDEVGLSTGLNDKLKTQLTAQSVLEALKFYVPTADYTSTSLKNTLFNKATYAFPSEIIVDGRDYNLSKNISISLKDTSGMLHIMYSSSKIMAEVLTPQKNHELRYVLSDSLDDWKDTDNVAKVNGAEQNTYRALDKKVLVRNTAAIQDIYELKMIQGFEELDFEYVKSNFYYGRGSSMNLMLINNKRYLAFLLGVDEHFMTKMLELRESEPSQYIKTITRLPNYNDDYLGFGLSKQFRIIITVQEGRARSVLSAIVSFKNLNKRAYVTISYTLK